MIFREICCTFARDYESSMNGIKKILATASAIFLPVLALSGQTPVTADIPELLRQEGFEDIRTKVQADTLYATLEDLTYRGTFRGAAKAIQLVAQRHPDINQFEIVLTDYKMPQLIVHASKREGIWDVSVDRETKQALRKLEAEKPTAASTGKIDITFFPIVSLVNNKLDHLFDYGVYIAPAIAATLWKGSRLTIQPIIPIINNLGSDDHARYPQLGNVSLSQQIISTKRWQASAEVGFFDIERVGAHAQIGFHALRGLDFYIHGGYTLEANYTKNDGFAILKGTGKFNFMAKADYYERHSRLQFELQAGRFLYGDYGTRLDITRHFAEYAIGLYGIYTAGETNAGFHFAIPVGGKRQRRGGFVRPRLPEYFNWEYSMKSYFKYYQEKMGRGYTTQPDQNHAAHYWEPDFVQEYVSRILNGTFQ